MENDCVDPFFQALLSPKVEGLQGSCRVSTSHFRVNTGATGGALAWARRGGRNAKKHHMGSPDSGASSGWR